MRANARNTDSLSSVLAGEAIEASGVADTHRRICQRFVMTYPGNTSAELAKLCGLERHQAARRLPEIAGIEKRDGEWMRECRESKRLCATWWPR